MQDQCMFLNSLTSVKSSMWIRAGWLTIILSFTLVLLLYTISGSVERNEELKDSISQAHRTLKALQSSKRKQRLPDALIMGVKKCGTITLGFYDL